MGGVINGGLVTVAVTGRGRELIVVELLKTYNIERVYKKRKTYSIMQCEGLPVISTVN